MKKYLLVSIFCFSVQFISAQTLSNTLLGYQESFTQIIGQTNDSAGNIYYAGTFKGECKINSQTVFTGNGGNDVFVAKTNAEGQLLWVKKYGDVGNESCNSILFHNGALYLAMNFSKSGVIDGNTVNIYGTDKITTVIAKLDTVSGAVNWLKKTTMPVPSLSAYGNIIFVRGTLQPSAGVLYYEDNLLIEFANTFRTGLLYIDTSGSYLGNKIMASSISPSNNLSTISVSTPYGANGNKLFFLIYAGSTSGGIKVGATSITFPTASNYAVLVKTDTSFLNPQYRILNPNGENYISTLIGEVGFSVSNKGDSLYMILGGTSNTGSYQLDGYNIPVGDQNLLLVTDTNFTTGRVKPLNIHRINGQVFRLFFNRITVDSGYYYFHGRFTGSNDAKPVAGIPVNKVEVDLLYGFKDSVNLNGPSESFLIKVNKDFTQYKHKWLGKHSPYESVSVGPAFFTSRGNKLYFLHTIDNVWNPWLVDTSLNILAGSMTGNADRAENTVYVKYLNDGSKVIIGQSRGKTALDSSSAVIPGNLSKTDLFFVVMKPDNSTRWYKRMFSSFNSIFINKIVTRNERVYVTATFTIPRNSGNYNYIRIDSSVTFITPQTPQTNLLFSFDKNGSFTILQMPAPFQTISIFDVFPNGDLAVVSRLSGIALQVPGKTFNTNTGFYVAKVDLNGTIKDAIKYSAPVGATGGSSPNEIMIDTITNTFKVVSSLSFNTGETTKALDFLNGTGASNFFIVNNPIPASTDNKNYFIFSRSDFTTYKGTSIFGPANATFGRGNAVLKNYTYFMLGKSGFSDPMYFNGTQIVADANTFVSVLLALDTSCNLFRHKVINSSNNNTFLLGLNSLTPYKDRLYASGSISAPVLIDTIQINHAGASDAVTIQLDTLLKAKRVFRLGSIYSEGMAGCDIFADTLISFAYTAQGVPVLTNNRIASRTSSIETQTADLDENAYIGTVLVKADIITAVDNLPAVEQFNVYPNPVVNNNVYIDLGDEASGNFQWMLYNADGKLIDQSVIVWNRGQAKNLTFNRSLKPGTYVLVIKTGRSGKLKAVKLTVLQ